MGETTIVAQIAPQQAVPLKPSTTTEALSNNKVARATNLFNLSRATESFKRSSSLKILGKHRVNNILQEQRNNREILKDLYFQLPIETPAENVYQILRTVLPFYPEKHALKQIKDLQRLDKSVKLQLLEMLKKYPGLDLDTFFNLPQFRNLGPRARLKDYVYNLSEHLKTEKIYLTQTYLTFKMGTPAENIYNHIQSVILRHSRDEAISYIDRIIRINEMKFQDLCSKNMRLSPERILKLPEAAIFVSHPFIDLSIREKQAELFNRLPMTEQTQLNSEIASLIKADQLHLLNIYKKLPITSSPEEIYKLAKKSIKFLSRSEAIDFISDKINANFETFKSICKNNLLSNPNELLNGALEEFRSHENIFEFILDAQKELTSQLPPEQRKLIENTIIPDRMFLETIYNFDDLASTSIETIYQEYQLQVCFQAIHALVNNHIGRYKTHLTQQFLMTPLGTSAENIYEGATKSIHFPKKRAIALIEDLINSQEKKITKLCISHPQLDAQQILKLPEASEFAGFPKITKYINSKCLSGNEKAALLKALYDYPMGTSATVIYSSVNNITNEKVAFAFLQEKINQEYQDLVRLCMGNLSLSHDAILEGSIFEDRFGAGRCIQQAYADAKVAVEKLKTDSNTSKAVLDLPNEDLVRIRSWLANTLPALTPFALRNYATSEENMGRQFGMTKEALLSILKMMEHDIALVAQTMQKLHMSDDIDLVVLTNDVLKTTRDFSIIEPLKNRIAKEIVKKIKFYTDDTLNFAVEYVYKNILNERSGELRTSGDKNIIKAIKQKVKQEQNSKVMQYNNNLISDAIKQLKDLEQEVTVEGVKEFVRHLLKYSDALFLKVQPDGTKELEYTTQPDYTNIEVTYKLVESGITEDDIDAEINVAIRYHQNSVLIDQGIETLEELNLDTAVERFKAHVRTLLYYSNELTGRDINAAINKIKAEVVQAPVEINVPVGLPVIDEVRVVNSQLFIQETLENIKGESSAATQNAVNALLKTQKEKINLRSTSKAVQALVSNGFSIDHT